VIGVGDLAGAVALDEADLSPAGLPCIPALDVKTIIVGFRERGPLETDGPLGQLGLEGGHLHRNDGIGARSDDDLKGMAGVIGERVAVGRGVISRQIVECGGEILLFILDIDRIRTGRQKLHTALAPGHHIAGIADSVPVGSVLGGRIIDVIEREQGAGDG